ncbi:MAG: radical SAM protein [Deltaproteobacteria bacterium]|nr:radical SAM protein [Deltaproteobacteria bacterium]
MVGSIEAQVEKELVQRSFSGRGAEERLVRVNFACNQACDFCFVSTHLPTAPLDDVRRAIVEASADGKRVVLSGGEPVLNPKLVEYVRLAKEHAAGRWPVELQTNAVLLDDRAKVDALVQAGLESAFVSLHGSRAEISDVVTGAPGTFARTVVGVDNLVRAGVAVILNFVICTANKDDLPSVVELIAARWPGVPLNISFVAPSTDVVPRERWLIPRYADAMPHLEEAFVRARALSVPLTGFESMCGLPLCLVPERLADFLDKEPILEGGDEGEFMRAPACEGCAIASRCWGVRRGYAEIHGTDELRTVKM